MGRELVAARGLTIRTRAPRGGGNRRLHGFCTTCHIRTRRPPLPHTPGCAERNPRMCDIESRNCRFAALKAQEKQGGQPLRKQDGLGRGAHGNRPRAPPSDRSTLRQHGSPRHSQGTCPLRSQWVTEASFERPTTNKKRARRPSTRKCPLLVSDVLLSHGLLRSTIGARGLNFRVRNGTGCASPAMVADQQGAFCCQGRPEPCPGGRTA